MRKEKSRSTESGINTSTVVRNWMHGSIPTESDHCRRLLPEKPGVSICPKIPMNILKPITPAQAQKHGLRILSGPYNHATETWMLDNVIKDMARGKIPHAIVENIDGLELWRANHGWLVGGDE